MVLASDVHSVLLKYPQRLALPGNEAITRPEALFSVLCAYFKTFIWSGLSELYCTSQNLLLQLEQTLHFHVQPLNLILYYQHFKSEACNTGLAFAIWPAARISRRGVRGTQWLCIAGGKW